MSDLSTLVGLAEDAGVLRAYKVNEVPANPPGDYIVLALDAGNRKSTRTDGRSPGRTKGFSVQINAKTSDGIDALTTKVEAAFYDQNLTGITGSPFCWRALQVGPMRDPDGGGWLYALHTYRYNADS